MLLLHPVSVKKILEELSSEKLEIQEDHCFYSNGEKALA